MLVVGLTGGIATGKSTVAAMFQRLGSHIIDADQITRKLVEPNTPTWQKVVDFFGPKVIQADGQLKRKYLADQIFSCDRKRWGLNAIIHPPTVAVIENQLDELKKACPHDIVIADIPLLFEVEWPFAWDKVVVVVASQLKQFERLKLREKRLSQLKFKKRLRSQLSLKEKARRADWVIDTNGTMEKTEKQVAEIYRHLQEAAAEG